MIIARTDAFAIEGIEGVIRRSRMYEDIGADAVEGDILISEWIGHFKPHTINVIPLIEDKDHMLYSHFLLKAYLSDKNFEYQRVFFARSDPALNYGLLSAVIVNKIYLRKFYWQQIEENI